MDNRLPVAQDPEDENLRKQEIMEALHGQAVGGNIVAAVTIEKLKAEERYLNYIKGIDDDEDIFTPLADRLRED